MSNLRLKSGCVIYSVRRESRQSPTGANPARPIVARPEATKMTKDQTVCVNKSSTCDTVIKPPFAQQKKMLPKQSRGQSVPNYHPASGIRRIVTSGNNFCAASFLQRAHRLRWVPSRRTTLMAKSRTCPKIQLPAFRVIRRQHPGTYSADESNSTDTSTSPLCWRLSQPRQILFAVWIAVGIAWRTFYSTGIAIGMRLGQ